MPDRLKEIRARMDNSAPVTITGPIPLVEAFEQKDADIAWLLAEVERWKHVAKNDLYGVCWCDAPRPDCCSCPGAGDDDA